MPRRVRARIASDSKVSIELVERRARASTNTALVQQCRHVLTMCRAAASTVLVHACSHQGLLGNEITDALVKAAANGIARPEGAAQSCREWMSRWSGDPSPKEHAQVVNLEAALFWLEVSETQARARLRAAGRTRPTALSLVSANVLTLHPADEQPDLLVAHQLPQISMLVFRICFL